MKLSRYKTALVFRSDTPEKIKSVLRSAKEFVYKGVQLLAVKHTLTAARLLNNMGYEVKSPILFDYKWSGQYTPFIHQLATANFLSIHRRAFILNDIGTGKTLASLWAADYLMNVGDIHKVLILSPLSTLNLVWDDEIFTHFYHRKSVVLHAAAAKRRKLLADKQFDFYILNHDGFHILYEDLLDRKDIDHIIIDESTAYKNSRTDRYKLFAKFIRKRPDVSIWMMTGTPTPNAPTDAWSQIKLIAPQNVPRQFTAFRDMTMLKVSPFKWVPRQDATSIVANCMQPSIRFERDECMDLPETLYEDREVYLTKDQKHAYDTMLKELWLEVEDGSITAANEAVKLSKLVQIACGVVYDDDGEHRFLDANHRINTLKEIIEEAGGKVIIFVPFTGVTKLLEEELSKKYTVGRVDGTVSKSARDRIFRDFQKSASPQLLVAHPRTMSHGLTLTRAATIIWYAPYPSAETYTQANGRITREGQANKTFIIHMAATKVEQRMYANLKANIRLQGLLLQAIKEGHNMG